MWRDGGHLIEPPMAKPVNLDKIGLSLPLELKMFWQPKHFTARVPVKSFLTQHYYLFITAMEKVFDF